MSTVPSEKAVVKRVTTDEAIKEVYLMSWKNTKDASGSLFNANVFGEWYGFSKFMNDLDTQNIRQFKNYCLNDLKYKPATLNRKLAALSKLITHLRGIRGFRFEGGVPMVEYARERNARTFVVNDNLENLIVNTSNSTRYHYLTDLWRVLINTGCRLSEILSLEWEDILENYIFIPEDRAKNGESRHVPIFEDTLKIFKSKKEAGLPRPFPYTIFHCEYAWRKIKKQMGMEKEKEFVIHSLRHTCITRLLKRKVGIEIVQRIAGHKDIRMTLRYNHPTQQDIYDAVNVKGAETLEKKAS